jgi:hypothetical protein
MRTPLLKKSASDPVLIGTFFIFVPLRRVED